MNRHKHARSMPYSRALPVRRMMRECLRTGEAAQAAWISGQILSMSGDGVQELA